MNDKSQKTDCYCSDIDDEYRQRRNIPDGYCGLCDICGKPGHVQAHPQYPTTGCWCEEHLQQITQRQTINIRELVFFILGLAVIIYTAMVIL